MRREREETNRENTGPDVPGRVGAEAFTSYDCSSWHGCTESTSVWWKNGLYFGGKGERGGCEDEGPEKGTDPSFYTGQARHRRLGVRVNQTSLFPPPHTAIRSPALGLILAGRFRPRSVSPLWSPD